VLICLLFLFSWLPFSEEKLSNSKYGLTFLIKKEICCSDGFARSVKPSEQQHTLFIIRITGKNLKAGIFYIHASRVYSWD
jgi:hypothetical protein